MAVLALSGHSIAMLLGSALLPAAKAEAAALPTFVEICTPQGVVLRPLEPLGDQHSDDLPHPLPDSDSLVWNDCPICSAFGQQVAGLPSGILIGSGGSALQPPILRSREGVQRSAARLPQTRAPPAR